MIDYLEVAYMRGVKITNKIEVDEPQNVEKTIYYKTGKKVDFELIKKFILNEKNTMFYLDGKMNSSTQPGNYSEYLWIDTGFRDPYDHPIMISLHANHEDHFVGHFTGTMVELINKVKSANKRNAKEIEKNSNRFLSKYQSKSRERNVICIDNQRDYAVTVTNFGPDHSQQTAFAKALLNAGVEIGVKEQETIENEQKKEIEEKNNELHNEMTIELLVDQMQSMQSYIDELLRKIEKNEKTSKAEIEELRAQNQAYKSALINIRIFNEDNKPEVTYSDEKVVRGHNLLTRNEKILVLGNTDIGVNEMKAIARDYYGFEKGDFVFITDYAKVKKAGERVHNSEKYAVIIFGNCPHKVAGTKGYSSIIEEFKQRGECKVVVDARTMSGELKITKQSFREALTKVYQELKLLQETYC